MDNKIINYIIFALEEYKKKNNVSGCEAAKVFDKEDLYTFIVDNYEALHTQSSENLLLDIDEYVGKR